MLGHRELTLQDYIAILKRRFWLILATTILLLGVGIGLTYVIPPQFQSQTLVIVQQQKVPENYVKPVITEDLNVRLASMQEQILSRSRLEPIIERYSLFAGSNNTMDDRVDMTRKSITIKPIAAGANKTPGFYITFKAPSARTAQQVCSDITSLFLSESLSAREQSAEGTTAFLSQQLGEAKRGLDDQDAKLAAFQQKYLGRLPGQEQSNLNTLQALTARLDAATQSLNRLQQDETFLNAVVSQQTTDLQSADPTSGASLNTLQAELKTLTTQKKELEALYTPDYPDLVALSRRISDLQKEIEQASAHPASTDGPETNAIMTNSTTTNPSPGKSATANATTSRPDPPNLQQAKAQLRFIRQSIVDQKQQQARIAQQVHAYEARIEATPAVEAGFKQVTRDHETALEFYNNLLAKMNESSMATNLERRQQGEQFQVLDAANLPDQPSFPNPYVFAGGGFIAGVLLGLLIAALLEYRDTSLRSEQDIYAFTKLPTLAIISYVQGLGPAKGKRGLFGRSRKALESANG
jgi:polysaccharide chain length determinant protein (PEP-CTERM system associated)